MLTGKTLYGVGASLLRKEDDRHLRGRGQFVADIALPGTAGGRVPAQPARPCPHPLDLRAARGAGPGLHRGRPAADASRSASSPRRPARKSPPWPPLATDKVRYVGEAIAACVAPTRAEAEDLAAAVTVDFEPLDAVVDAPRGARAGGAAGARILGRQSLPASARSQGGDIEAAARAADDHRQPRIPHEPAVRGRRWKAARVLAYRDHRLDEVVVYASTQTPHTMRVALGEILGHRGAPHPGRRARCRRRVRAEGAALSRRRSSSPRWRSNSTTRCAGSRTATSIC